MKVYVDACFTQHTSGDSENAAAFVNSISRWDGTTYGGANCMFLENHPDWPYILLYTVTELRRGDELLVNYHDFPSVKSKIACHISCELCYARPPGKRARSRVTFAPV